VVGYDKILEALEAEAGRRPEMADTINLDVAAEKAGCRGG